MLLPKIFFIIIILKIVSKRMSDLTKNFPRLRPSILQLVILLLMGAVYATMNDHQILLLMKAQMEKSNTVTTNECIWEDTDEKT
jgi:hypothetical protein